MTASIPCLTLCNLKRRESLVRAALNVHAFRDEPFQDVHTSPDTGRVSDRTSHLFTNQDRPVCRGKSLQAVDLPECGGFKWRNNGALR
jgi:hypothetical protein